MVAQKCPMCGKLQTSEDCGETLLRLALTFSLNRVDRADRTTLPSNVSVTDKTVASWRLFPRR